MAQYTTTQRIAEEFAGRVSFGTSGTCLMTEGQGTRIIASVSNYIDYKLQSLYGTYSPLFGTNVLGTTTIPEIIEDCCTYLSLCRMFKNTSLTIMQEQSDWIGTICNDGKEILEMLVNEESEVIPFAGTLNNYDMAIVGGQYGTIIGEEITLNGTNLVDLSHAPIIRQDFRVYGTALDSPTTYYEGTHYNAYFYGNEDTGSNYGKIRGIEADIIPVRVDYHYIIPRAFNLNDFAKWGEGHKETR